MSIVKSFLNHFGLDLKSSDIARDPRYASDMLNAQYKKNGNVGKREGYRCAAGNFGGSGLFTYNRINPVTAKEEISLVAVSDKIYNSQVTTVDIAYSGAELSVVLDIFFDTTALVYKTQIVEGTTQVLDHSMGTGIDEVSPLTLADLKIAIEGISGDYTVTITGNDAVPSAFIDLARSVNLFLETPSLEALSWVEVNTPLASMLPGNVTFQSDSDYYLTTATQLNNNLYMSNGYDEVIKYDGQNSYRAGMPGPIGGPITALGVAGAVTGTYRHSYLYTQFDASLNEIQGNMSADSFPDLSPSAETIDVTVDNIADTSGFNTNAAIVDGVQAGVNTINVDDGSGGSHTLQPGDTAYFFDGVSGDYVERNVDSITGTSITIAGAAVDVADNAVISNNLRISIYRNKTGGTFKFLVEEIPNNPFVATQIYNDNVVDAALGIQYIEPLSPHDLPPKGRYITSYNNQMFSAGSIENPNTVSWSSVESPEYFAPDIYSLRIQSPNGDKISGIQQSNEVRAIFEKRAMHVISGDIPNNNIRVDTITKDIGCVSHNTIR